MGLLDPADVVAEIDGHLSRILGSRGEVVTRIEQKWGRLSLAAVVVDPNAVELRVREDDGSLPPVDAENMPPGSSNESALGYVVGRLLCRGLVTADEVRQAPPLPNERTFPDLRAVEIALMPQSLHVSLGELHAIGFTGMPEGPPGCVLSLEGGPRFFAYESAPALKAEIDELIGRVSDKFRPLRGSVDRFQECSLHCEVDDAPVTIATGNDDAGNGDSDGGVSESALPTVSLRAGDWELGSPDLALVQWVLTHLLRPRKLNPFLPMRPLIVLPREIPTSSFLRDGRHLADLPAIRHQLMPAKLAQLLGDVHRRGIRGDSDHSDQTGVILRMGPLRIATRSFERDRLLQQARDWTQPLVGLFREEGGGEEKYGPVTLEIEPRDDNAITFKSANFLPGCPDEILCEYVVACWLQDDTIPLSAVQSLGRIGKRSVVAAPSIEQQLVPGGTVELIECVHTGRAGPGRGSSGWKIQVT